ncbi:unnamed protein product [Auanema sp. JU1783]|nr:unnamed protein product [Auanema sp. JU1783]
MLASSLVVLQVLLVFLQLPTSSTPAFHDVKWTGNKHEDIVAATKDFVKNNGYSRVRRKRDAVESLFSSEEDYDEDDVEIMGSIFTQLMADSNSQLILDLDFFKYFFNYAEAYRMGMEEGNVEYMKYVLLLMEKLRSFDISAACVADMFHLGSTALEYATMVEETKNCTDCKCTPLYKQKRNERTWIFDVLDAQGKIPSGILGGNNLWIGSWNTCRKVHVVKNNQGQYWNGQYCMTHIAAYDSKNPLKSFVNNKPPNAHCFETNETVEEDNGKCFELLPLLNFGVCAPDTCTDYDVTRMLTFAAKLAESVAGVEIVCDVTVECRRENEETAMSNNKLAMFALYFLIFTIVMMIFGTCYDLIVFQKLVPIPELPVITDDTSDTEKCSADDEFAKQKHARKKKLDKIKDESGLFIRSMLAYSVYENGKTILDTSPKKGEIECLHGLRVLSMCWIILGHTYYYIGRSLTTDNLVPTLINFPKLYYTQLIVQAPLAVDSFFFLSGLLSSYLFFKRVFIRYSLKTAKSVLPWLAYFIKRYTRLTPVYAVIMLFDVTLFTYVSSGPFWRPIERLGCAVSGWTNFVYLNNFLLQDQECCMGWTWYLANDMQFQIFLLPTLVIAFSWYFESPKWTEEMALMSPDGSTTPKKIRPRPTEPQDNKRSERLGLIVTAVLLFISTTIKLFVVYSNDYPPAPILTTKLQIVEQLDSYWNDVYIRPYIRCAPFIIGILLGYFLNIYTNSEKNLELKLTKMQLISGWFIFVVLLCFSVFGLEPYARTGDISQIWRFLYTVFGRLSFALALCWLTFACVSGNGGIVNTFLSWKFFLPLSRITFGAYLIHPIMLQIYNFARLQPFHFSSFLQMLRHTFEAVFVSYFMAFLIVLAFEKPFGVFDDYFIPLKEKKEEEPKPQTTTIEEVAASTQ